MSDPVGPIEQIVAPVVEDLGLVLVRVSVAAGRGRPAVQVMAERPNGAMSIEDCARLSRALSAVFEAADPIRGEYTLEVSSPGVDRPLVRLEDFDRFAGQTVKVETAVAVDGQRRFRGQLLGVDGDAVRMMVEDRTIAIAFADIARAKVAPGD
ncbi:MAG: ribosome maturation factor RimP, partial [Sphingomonadales bacterium]